MFRAACALVAVAALPARAGAEPAIAVAAPCSDAAEVARRLRDEAIEVSRPLRLEIVPITDGFQATVSIGFDPPRRLVGRRCRDLVDAALVVAVLALDAARAADGAVTGASGARLARSRPGAAPALAAVRGSPRADPARRPPGRRGPTPVLEVALLIEDGVLPGPTAGGRFAAGLEWPSIRVLVGTVLLDDRTIVSRGRTFQLDLWTGELRGCVGRRGLHACVGGELGVVGVDTPAALEPGTGRFVAGLAELGGELRISRSIRGLVFVSGHLLVSRPIIEYSGGEIIFRPDRAALRAGLGLAVSIP